MNKLFKLMIHCCDQTELNLFHYLISYSLNLVKSVRAIWESCCMTEDSASQPTGNTQKCSSGVIYHVILLMVLVQSLLYCCQASPCDFFILWLSQYTLTYQTQQHTAAREWFVSLFDSLDLSHSIDQQIHTPKPWSSVIASHTDAKGVPLWWFFGSRS